MLDQWLSKFRDEVILGSILKCKNIVFIRTTPHNVTLKVCGTILRSLGQLIFLHLTAPNVVLAALGMCIFIKIKHYVMKLKELFMQINY